MLVTAKDVDEDELVLLVADAGADDVELDGSTFAVTSPPEAFGAVLQCSPTRASLRRVGGARDGAEDDRRGVGRVHGAGS